MDAERRPPSWFVIEIFLFRREGGGGGGGKSEFKMLVCCYEKPQLSEVGINKWVICIV
jgi:hypothetical protein